MYSSTGLTGMSGKSGLVLLEDQAIQSRNSQKSHLTAASAPNLAFPFTIDGYALTSYVGAPSLGIVCLFEDSSNWFGLYMNSGGLYARLLSGGSNATDSIANFNGSVYKHFACTVTATAVELFVDGVSSGSPAAHVLTIPSFASTWIGTLANANVCLDAIIDEVRIWDSELAQADITALATAGGVLSYALVQGTVAIPSAKKPIHAWSCDNLRHGMGTDLGTTGGVDLTRTNIPLPADGITAGKV